MRPERNCLIAGIAAAAWLLGLLLYPAREAAAAEVRGVRVWRAPERTRIVFDLDSAVEYHLIRLDEVGQLLIDLEDSGLAQSLAGLAGLAPTEGPVIGLGLEEAPGDSLRFVVELAASVTPRGFVLPPIAQYGDRLVIDLYDIDSQSPLESPTAPASVVPPMVSPPPAVPSLPDLGPMRDIVVAIAAGHGGEDPGAVVGKDYEKDINLAVSRYLYERLAAASGYRPVMIREGDYAVALRRRADLAREHRADLLLAIHADAYRASSVSGMTIYALSGDRADRENAARVARKENAADLIAGVESDLRLGEFEDDVALALVSMHMGWSMEQSLLAGEHILRAAGGVTRLRKDRVQQASLAVLISPDIPSILIETGYMTNPAELSRLTSPGFQRRLADAMARGVMSYFEERAPEGTLVAWRKANTDLSAAAIPGEVGRMADTLVNALGESTEPGGEESGFITHAVRRGDTLSAIAERYSVSLPRLRELNQLVGDHIEVGRDLKISRQ